MTYPPAWERLSDAVTHVTTAAGVSKVEAQSDICQAIADRTVKIRGKLQRHTTRHLTSRAVLEGTDFEIPTAIKPKGLDWERSRPVKPWFVRRGTTAPAGYWDLAWIELSMSDVTNVLCPAGTRAEAVQMASRVTGATGRSRPALERARRAVTELYPEGVPGQAAEPNANLYRRVGEKLRNDGLLGVSDDTILRAAGRRK
jgi:hypothetical protein